MSHMKIRSLLREPLVHFLLLGAALFLFFSWTGGSGGPGSDRIVIGPGQVERLATGFGRTWRRPPTQQELKGLVDDYVREEMVTRPGFPGGSIVWADGVHGKTEEILTGGPGASRPVGFRSRSRSRLAMGLDSVGGGEDRVHVGDPSPLGAPGRA